jgi:hypothetical protein
MKQMNLIIKTAMVLIVALGFAACQKEIEFDQRLIEPKLVINSFICADSIIEASIALSRPIPGVQKSYEWVNNAKVVLYTNGEKTEELSVFEIEYPEEEDYYYYYGSNNDKPTVVYRTINTKAEAGKTYKLEVTHAEHETAYGETTLPIPIDIIELDTETKTMNYEYGGSENQLIVKMKFKDRPNEENYYRITFTRTWGSKKQFYEWETYTDTSYTIVVSTRQEGNYLNTSDKLLSSDNDANNLLFGSPNNRYNLFTDELIQGKEYELSFVAISEHIYEGIKEKNIYSNPGEFHHIDVKLSTISREAFLYMKSSSEQNWYGNDFFTEPVQAFSNIKNGAGIVAGYSSAVKSIRNGTYPIDTIKYEIDNNIYY